jgi:hypothetical protein
MRQSSEAAVHQSGEVIVRGFLWCVIRKQFLQLDPQHLDEVIEFIIQDELQTRLDFGNTAPGDVPAGALQFRRQLRLRPLASVSNSPHLRADDVVIFQKFCAFLGAKLGRHFGESSSAYGASFQNGDRKIARAAFSPTQRRGRFTRR